MGGGWEVRGGRWEVGGGRWGGRWEVGGCWEVGGGWVGGGRCWRWEAGRCRAQGGRVGLGGSVWCVPKFFGSVRYGSGRFDTILGESIVETAMTIGVNGYKAYGLQVQTVRTEQTKQRSIVDQRTLSSREFG